jgi:hypothetical protein
MEKYWPDMNIPVPAYDACLLTGLGHSLLMQKGDYRRAKDICSVYLSLPDAKSEDLEFRLHHIWRGFTLIASGAYQDGISELEPWLADKIGRIEIRNSIYHVLPIVNSKDGFDMMRSLTTRLLGAWPQHSQLALNAEKAESTSDLIALLESTHPKRASQEGSAPSMKQAPKG